MFHKRGRDRGAKEGQVGTQCRLCGQRDWELVPNTVRTYRCKHCGNVAEMFMDMDMEELASDRAQLSPSHDLVFDLTIPKGEAEKLRSHDSFIPTLEQIQKQNFSSALKSLEKVLKDNPRSKYLLLLKAACIHNSAQEEFLSELDNTWDNLKRKVDQAIFDSEAFDRFLEVCQDYMMKRKNAIDILKDALRIDPNFHEAKRNLKFAEKGYRGLKQEIEEMLWRVLKNALGVLSPRQFEKFIAYLFSKMGFHVEITPFVSDFGADIIAETGDNRIVIQVKKYIGANVGAQEVQQTLGSIWRYKADKAILVTTTDFTTQAVEQAKGAPIELWNKNILHRMIENTFVIR